MIKHELQKEIYRRGFTTIGFAKKCELERKTLYNIYTHRYKKLRGDTIGRISIGLGISYEECEKLCYGR